MKEKVAIIGSGISGLSAAYLLSNKYDVYLYEKNIRLGGHTRTIYVNESSKQIPIDTGFIVFNEKNYPDLTKFFQHLKIECRDSNMSFAVSNKFNESPAKAAIIAPTIITEEIAFVTDIKGVCNEGVTLQTT